MPWWWSGGFCIKERGGLLTVPMDRLDAAGLFGSGGAMEEDG